jgi:predicted ATPase
MNRFVVISGCSGGGKSALLAELGRRGYAVVAKPGRRIAREELNSGGSALPWADEAEFARHAVSMALADRTSAAALDGWVLFDRGLIDAAAGLRYLTGKAVLATLALSHRYHRRVFLAPPWPEICATGAERRHDFNTALGEYSRLLEVYPSLGYDPVVLPKVAVSERADFVLTTLTAPP